MITKSKESHKTRQTIPHKEKELEKLYKLLMEISFQKKESISIWKLTEGFNVKLSIKKQIEMLYNSICFDINMAGIEEFDLKNKSDIIGRKYNDLVKENTSDQVFKEFIKNNYILQEFEAYRELRSGKIKYTIENWFGLFENDQLLYFCVYSNYITQNKIIEQSFVHQIFETNRILESMLNGFILINNNGQIIRVNPAYCEMIGYTEDELLKMKIHNLEAETSSNHTTQQMKKIGTYSSARFEAKHRHKDGHLIDVDISIVIMQHNGNSQIAAFIRDITQNKITEKELRQERNKAQNFLDIAGVIIVGLDKNGNVILINHKGSEILGYDQNKIIGKNWITKFIPTSQRKEIRAVMKNIVNNDIKLFEYYENPVLTKEGEEKLIAWHNALLKDENNNIIGVLSSGEDITLRRQYENQLRTHSVDLENLVKERTKELEKSNRKLKKHTEELETFNKVMLDRELRIIGLKKEVNTLCNEFGQEIKYPPVWEE